jgi:hypothetical protein
MHFIRLIVSIVLLTLQGFGQVGTATLSGTVTDPTGAVIPSAEAVLKSSLQQFSRQTVHGDYVIPAIPPGKYELAIRAKGFADETRSDISLDSGQASTLNVTMTVAGSTQQVSVSEAPPLLQTTTATVGTVVATEQIQQLPLLGRVFTSLLLVAPGVSTAPTPRGGPLGATTGANSAITNPFAGTNPSINGQRGRDNNYTLDGVENNEPLFNGIPMLPPPESLTEMKLEAAMSSGAYGHSSGANINLVTRSGTNALHGDAWEFLRNDATQARSFFVPKLGPYRFNQFGGTLGGPLVIPHLIHKDNGWYFFVYYEGIRIHQAANTTSNVPTAAQIGGDFSGNATLFNPYSTATDSVTGKPVRQPFPNNQIPASLISPAAKIIATSLYPLPNLPPNAIPGNNFFNPGSAVSDGNQWNARLDHQFDRSDNFFARYTDADNPSSTIGFPTLPTVNYNRFTNAAVSETHLFSPTFLITSRFGLQRLDYGNATAGDHTVASRAGTVDAFPLFHGQDVIPPIAIAGYASLSQGLAYYGPQYLLSWIADGHKISGSHSFDFGGSIVRTAFKTDNQSGTQVQFTTTQTSNFVAGTGFALASFLLGLPDSAGRVFGSSEGDYYGNAYSIYFQDNWRVTPKVTVNLGLRWDFASPMINRIGSGTFIYETGQYVWTKKNPITGAPPNISPGVLDPDYHNIQPRVGIAYQTDNKTVIRASYGIFFDTFGVNYAQTQQGNRGDWPFAFPQTVSGLNATTPNAFLQNPFPGPAQGSTTPLGCLQCLNAWGPTSRTPYVQEWTFSVQRQLANSVKAEARYFGSHGVKISSQIVDNTALYPALGPIAPRQLWPQFPAYVNNGYNGFSSYYEGLSLVLEKRFSRGLLLSANYTWSKAQDYVDELSDNIQLFGSSPTRINAKNWKGPAGFDVPQRFVASYVYEIPGKTGSRLANAIVSNWSLSGIVSVDNGVPYSARLSADAANIGTVPGRYEEFPNLVGNPYTIPNRQPQQWFNTAAFQVPSLGTFGGAGRNILRTDGIKSWNASVQKQWPLAEKRWIELRGEFFNILNRTSFGYPGFIADSPQFGKQSTTFVSGRQVQIAVKIHF